MFSHDLIRASKALLKAVAIVLRIGIVSLWQDYLFRIWIRDFTERKANCLCHVKDQFEIFNCLC